MPESKTFFEKLLKEAIKKLCSKFGWSMTMKSCWYHVPTLPALAWNRQKNARIQLHFWGGETAEIKISYQNPLKDAIKKQCSKIGWPTAIGNLWNRVPKLGTWALEDEDAAAEDETKYGSKSRISQVNNLGTITNFVMHLTAFCLDMRDLYYR